VPHPTTLMKVATRCGSAAVDGLHEALLAKAVEAKLLRTTRLRADTTVVPADVSYLTDSGLLAKAVRRIAATGRRIQAGGGAVRRKVRDRSRAAGKHAHDLGSTLKLRTGAGQDAAQAAVVRVSGELAGLADARAPTRLGYWPMPRGRCGEHEPKPRSWVAAAKAMRSPGDGGGGWRGRSTI